MRTGSIDSLLEGIYRILRFYVLILLVLENVRQKVHFEVDRKKKHTLNVGQPAFVACAEQFSSPFQLNDTLLIARSFRKLVRFG